MRRRTTWLAVALSSSLLIWAVAPTAPSATGLSLTAAAAPAAPSGSDRPTLVLGARGPAVAVLQERLRALGSPVRADSTFGLATRQAVVALQAARGLVADGIVGPRTWQILDGAPTPAPSPVTTAIGRPVLRRGSVGPAVADLQRLLSAAGQRVAADGRFGAGTQAAVVAVQRARGLAADGTVGPATWAALGSPGAPATATATLISLTTAPWLTIGARSYVVRSSDTLVSVAAATHSTPAALATANRLAPGSGLAAGGTVLVPGGWQCPVPGAGFINDYGFARAGHLHEGNDLFAARGTPVLAPVAGRVQRREGGLGGHAVNLYGQDGHRYYFAHLDRFGATGSVAAGAVIGFVGNSGNASTTVTHLHFEIHPSGGAPVNPFATLTLACRH